MGVINSDKIDSDSMEKDLVAFVATSPEAMELWVEFNRFSHSVAEQVSASEHAFCFEICKDTWSEARVLRLHGHLFLRREADRMRVADPLIFAWKVQCLTQVLQFGGRPWVSLLGAACTMCCVPSLTVSSSMGP